MGIKDAYITCRVCGGKGYYPKIEKVGNTEIETPVWCVYCGGKGQILASKLFWSEKKIARRNRKRE